MKILFILLLLTGCKSSYYSFFPNDHGKAKVSIDLDKNILQWSVEPKNLDGIVVIHIVCLSGEQAGVTFSSTVFNLVEPRIKGTALTPDKGNFCGWLTFKEVKKSIEDGNAYVHIHTYGDPVGAVSGKLQSLNMRERFSEIWSEIKK